MLDRVKSIHFVKKLFRQVSEGKKLKVVKYNRNIQHKLNVTILDYKSFIGTYTAFEGNGIVREYYSYNDVILFEGEYLNGRRNGYGKLYNEDAVLIYEGTFLNGRKHGKGKEYNDDGDLILDGEFVNDQRKRGKVFVKGILEYEGVYFFNKKWNGSGYDKNGNVVYVLVNGNGICREYNENGELVFEGEYIEGKRNRNGIGKEFSNGEMIYHGKYFNKKRHGKGKEYTNGKLTFEGEYSYGKRNGHGKEYDENGILLFNGNYLNGQRVVV